MKRLLARARWLALSSQTVACRFWFGFTSLGFGSFLIFSGAVHNPNSEYRYMIQLASDEVWAAGFVVYGIALLYGVFTRSFSKIQLYLEGVLGVAVWAGGGIAVSLAQGTPGAMSVGALLAFWLLVRYPTHWEYFDAD
jgi:ABC-type transport system involved in multi-copper enzyme maturation permease subunit